MPIAKTTAPEREAASKLWATAPKATPTAKPSGILCIVIASTRRILLRK